MSMPFRFVSNLRPQSVPSFERVGHRPQAWLLSSHRLDAATEALAHAVRDAGLDLFADNGTKEAIDDFLDLFLARHVGVIEEIRALHRALPKGRTPRASEVPTGVRRAIADATEEVFAAVDERSKEVSARDLLTLQLSMRPSHLIAKEDYAIGLLIGLGFEREWSRFRVERFTRRNGITLDFWDDVASDARVAAERVAVYATLGAMDYNTARAAARLAARRGVSRVAVGFAGVNLDVSFVSSYLAGGRRPLSGAAPRRYVRLAEIVAGLRDGYRDEKRKLVAFHGLGLGALPQFPVLAAGFDPETEITVDATSPLHDAVRDLVIYDERARGERMTLLEAANETVRGGEPALGSPFFMSARERLGFDADAARTWWRGQGERALTLEDLNPEMPLGRALPVFATARSAGSPLVEVVRDATDARVGHNHWVADAIAASAPAGDARRIWGHAEIDALIASRSRATRWGLEAVREIFSRLA